MGNSSSSVRIKNIVPNSYYGNTTPETLSNVIDQILADKSLGYAEKYGENSDIALSVLLAFLYDSKSEFALFPKDVVIEILKWYYPNQPVHLLSKGISRSHYKICKEMCVDHTQLYRQEPKNPPFTLSTYAFDPGFQWTGGNLILHARNILNFLFKLVELKINFKSYSEERLNELINEYLLFIYSQMFTNPDSSYLIPSLEIQAIWFSHMLQSMNYSLFLSKLNDKFPYAGIHISKLSHVITKRMDQKQYEQIEKSTKKVLEKNLTSSKFKDMLLDRNFFLADFTFNTFMDDQMWIGELVKFTQGTDIFSDAFLQRAHLGYQRMLCLKSRHNDKVENIGFSPCPSIDLIWHSHLLSPSLYDLDTRALLGYPPAHKLLNENNRTLVFMNDRDNMQEEMWMKEFNESLFSYATCPVK